MRKIAEEALSLLRGGRSFAMAVVLESSGSTPRDPGAAMLICPDGAITGTIGGGVLEAHVIKDAKKAIAEKRAMVCEYALETSGDDAIGAICGGRAKTLIDYIDAADPSSLSYFEALFNAASGPDVSVLAVLASAGAPLSARNQCLIRPDGTVAGGEVFDEETLAMLLKDHKGAGTGKIREKDVYFFPVGTAGTVYIFGAGHVGQKLAKIVRTVAFRTVVIDDRAEFASRARFPDADEIIVPVKMDAPFDTLSFGPDSYIVIVTRGHAHDEVVLTRALRTDAGYIGMIGSKKKRERLYENLLQKGFTQEDIARVHSPIGLDIGAETPEEIAVSITAELIAVRAAKKKA
ncbi:MAG: XdhC family protein [Clostridiales bacterium]|nr:XdhC family protein [Clostridiales bacterium]